MPDPGKRKFYFPAAERGLLSFLGVAAERLDVLGPVGGFGHLVPERLGSLSLRVFRTRR